MTLRSKVLLAAAVLFLAVNLLGGLYAAAALREPLHALVHAVLTVLTAFLLVRAARRRRGRGERREAQPVVEARPAVDARLTQLEHSVGAVAVEVERIGEGQRYVTRLLTEDPTPTAEVGERA